MRRSWRGLRGFWGVGLEVGEKGDSGGRHDIGEGKQR